MLNVAFLTPRLKREFGGCAANIAYNMTGLGGEPVIMATVGHDGVDYLRRLQAQGIDTSHVHKLDEEFTAQAFITTDLADNQIIAFHPGAMSHAHQVSVSSALPAVFGIVAPNGKDAMLQHARDYARNKIPYLFDPGQGLPMFDGEDLKRFVSQATWVAVNDYEAKLLADRTGQSLAEISKAAHLKGLIETLGADGCNVYIAGEKTHVPGVKAAAVVDPTGCGDAFRGGLLHGLSQGWDLVKSVTLANRIGAIKIAVAGPQNYTLDRAALGA
jgi:adenosine kinase